MMSEKGYQFAEVTHEIKELPTGPKLVHLTFNIKEGPKVKIRHIEFIGNKQMSDGELTKQMKENRPQHWLSFITGRGTYQEPKFEEDAGAHPGALRQRGLHQRAHRHARSEGDRGQQGRQDALHRAEDSGHGRRPLQGRRPSTSTATRSVKAEALRPLFKLQEGEYFSMKKVRKGMDAARELYGTRRLLGVHRLPGPEAAQPARPDEGRRPEGARRGAQAAGDRRRDDAAAGGGAVLRQPHHVRRQHDDARHGGPPRDAPARERRLQHRGAQVQRQADQSAGLLQGDRGGARQPEDREDAGPEEQGRRHAEVPGAEPEPADIRRRRVAVRGLLRAALVPDGQLPGPRRERHLRGDGRVAGAELPARLQRAVPVRSPDHGRRQPLQSRDPVLLLLHAELARRQCRRRASR